jgi:hypothetical protein
MFNQVKIMLLVFFLCAASSSQAQSFEIQQLALDISKLAQLKTILSDLYKGYQILSAGYTAIKKISEGNFNLHQGFLNALLGVSPAVRNYARIGDIIQYQLRLVSEYKTAYQRFQGSRQFTPDELVYMGQVYGNLFNESLKDITNLIHVITAGAMRMSDAERLHAIDGIYDQSLDKYLFLRSFNSSASVLAAQRAAEASDAQTIQNLY